MEIDIRDGKLEDITVIRFADQEHKGSFQSHKLERRSAYHKLERRSTYIVIEDGFAEGQAINSKEHAENLIKALKKAVELSWLE